MYLLAISPATQMTWIRHHRAKVKGLFTALKAPQSRMGMIQQTGMGEEDDRQMAAVAVRTPSSKMKSTHGVLEVCETNFLRFFPSTVQYQDYIT